MKLRELAKRLECRLEGDGEIEVRRVAGIGRAEPGDLTFVANRRYLKYLSSTKASAVIIGASTAVSTPAAVLRCDRPDLAFAHAVALFVQVTPPPKGVDHRAAIAPDASVGPDVSIGPFVTVGSGARIGARCLIFPNVVIGAGATIGEDCILHAHVSIRDGVTLGHRVMLHDGVVVGSDGFGFVKQPDGEHFKIPQHADVIIEDDVEIGANTTVDRPAVGETRIAAGTKIDNLVQIGHGVAVGRRVLFAAQVGVSGSTVIADDVVLAGQVGVAGHVHIGKGVVATAQTGIPNSVEAGQVVSGYPAIPNRDWLKSSAAFKLLPALRKRVADLEHRIEELEEQIARCRIPSDR